MDEEIHVAVNQFTYCFDNDLYHKDGKAILYRNRIDEKGKFEFSRFKGGDDEYRPVIAEGITAYLAKSTSCKDDLVIVKEIQESDILTVFNRYFNEQVSRIYKSRLSEWFNLDEKVIIQNTIKESSERKFYVKSERYFSESLTDCEKRKKKTIEAYVDNYLQWVSNKIIQEDSVLRMKDEFTKKDLVRIFDFLLEKKIVVSEDRDKFVQLFQGYEVDQVFWDGEGYHGAKSTLFALVLILTGKWLTGSNIKKYFKSLNPNKPINDNWREGETTRMTDKMFPK
jgi:hypothetical protein